MQTGVNYFLNLLALDRDFFKVYYELGPVGDDLTTEQGDFIDAEDGSVLLDRTTYSSSPLGLLTESGGFLVAETSSSAYSIPSISGAASIYSGQFSNSGDRYGYFTGQSLRILNETGLYSPDWTMFFVYEKEDSNQGVLFSNYHGSSIKSGFVIGLTDANKLYFETYSNVGPRLIEAPLQLGQKNAIAVSKAGDSVYFNVFDFNSKQVQSSSFAVDSTYILNSTGWYLGNATNAPLYFSGKPFKGYLETFLYFNRALLPYQLNCMFSGFFANQSGIESLPYVHSFGMDGIAFIKSANAKDDVELFYFPNTHNKTSVGLTADFDKAHGEFFLNNVYPTGTLNMYVNGQAVRVSGVSASGNLYNPSYILQGDAAISGKQAFTNRRFTADDDLVYDFISSGSGAPHYFVNGVKQRYGTGSIPTGAANAVFSSPVDSGLFGITTGNFTSTITPRFAKGTSQVWRNGLRQKNGVGYVEISNVDLLTGNGSFVSEDNIFANDGTFWNPLMKRDLKTVLRSSIDSRIAGKTSAAKPMFSIQDHTVGNYIRNTDCWINDIDDITAISPWNSNGGPTQAGVLITPRHIIFTVHFALPAGAVIRFVTKDNRVVSRTIVQIKAHPSYTPYFPDICIGVLDSDVDDDIAFCKVLPSDWQTYLSVSSLNTAPAFLTDQEEKALIAEVYQIGTGYTFNSVPTDSQRLLFYEPVVTYDSSSPEFFVIDDTLVILFVMTSGGPGLGTSIVYQKTAINQMIIDVDALAGVSTGYTLTEMDLSHFQPS